MLSSLNTTQTTLPKDSHCYHVTSLISQWQDDDIRTLQKAEVQLHLLVCQNCRNFNHNVKQLHKMMNEFKKA